MLFALAENLTRVYRQPFRKEHGPRRSGQAVKLSGPDGEPDLEVWGQDRLWLVAAEIRRRASL